MIYICISFKPKIKVMGKKLFFLTSVVSLFGAYLAVKYDSMVAFAISLFVFDAVFLLIFVYYFEAKKVLTKIFYLLSVVMVTGILLLIIYDSLQHFGLLLIIDLLVMLLLVAFYHSMRRMAVFNEGSEE